MISRELRAAGQPERPLLALFLVLTLVPAALLLVFGWRMLNQDRSLALQQLEQQREQAADLVVASLQEKIAAAEQSLRDESAIETLPGTDDSVSLVFTGTGVLAFPNGRLLFYPVSKPRAQADDVFAEPEALEYQRGDEGGAAKQYLSLARSPDQGVRAGALVRLARVDRKIGDADAALEAYERMAAVSGATVNGVPADLVARWATCELLASLQRTTALKEEAAALYADLAVGKWQLDRAAYELHAQDVRRWLGIQDADVRLEKKVELSAAVDRLWQRWKNTGADQRVSSMREVMVVDATPWTVLSQARGAQLIALVAGPSYVDSHWLGPIRAVIKHQDLDVTLNNPAARVGGQLDASDSRRFAADTGLPWTITVTQDNLQAALGRVNARRRVWLAGLAMLGLVVAGGVAIIGRAVAREMTVARLQSDFVAAVSHEFRTPLTAMHQVTESLADDRVPDESRSAYYRVLQRQTGRLHRLVESLLDFGRMEAGRSPYRLQPTDVREFVERVVRQFEEEAAGRGYAVETSLAAPAPAIIAADQDALSTAVWNLLDNAVKYSPACRTIWVDLKIEDGRVDIRVRDRGYGIAKSEQARIFHKFVRGSAAQEASIAGTGIGLSMVRHIIAAHGGDVSVASTLGEGSTFTISLPTQQTGSREAEG